MALLFLIPILVCGYVYLTSSHIHKFKIKKTEGQQLYFKCALHGFYFTILGFSLTTFLITQDFYIFDKRLSLSFLQNKLVEGIFYSVNLQDISKIENSSVLQESKRNIGFYSLFFLSFLMSLFLTFSWIHFNQVIYLFRDFLKIINTTTPLQYIRAFLSSIKPIFRKLYLYLRHQLHLKPLVLTKKSKKINSRAQEFKEIWWKWKYGINGIKKEIKNPLDSLLYQSIENHQNFKTNLSNTKLIMITMNDRKVYIGLVVGFGKDNDVFSVDNETFFFLPVKSGYRNKYDLRVCVTTDYSAAISSASELDDIQIILNKKSIVSACKFDESRFKSFDKSPQFFKIN